MLKKRKASVLLCLVILFLGVGLFTFGFERSGLMNNMDREDISSKLVTSSQKNERYEPTRLIIPKIGVDAEVEHVGYTTKYTMASPSNYSNVGWYRHGTLPGEKGSAVIAGHLDNGFGFNAVFGKLDQLKNKDEIYIIDEGGKKLEYIVINSEIYDYTDAPLEKIFNENDESYLKLITCRGSWVSNDETYDNRLVVTAVLKK